MLNFARLGAIGLSAGTLATAEGITVVATTVASVASAGILVVGAGAMGYFAYKLLTDKSAVVDAAEEIKRPLKKAEAALTDDKPAAKAKPAPKKKAESAKGDEPAANDNLSPTT